MNRSVDLARLQGALGVPELDRLIAALQKRLELGRPLNGTLTLAAASTAERIAVDTLLGRNSTRGASLQIDLDLLTEALREAGICTDLPTAVKALRGPVINRRAANFARLAGWSAWAEQAELLLRPWPLLQNWPGELASAGWLKRITGDDLAIAAKLSADLATLAAALPAQGDPLAALAVRLFGNAHALDTGTPRATLAVRAAARLGRIDFEDDAEGRRMAWGSVGVMCDELSTPALVLNLPVAAETPLGRLLRAAGADAEPLHVSLRALLRWPLSCDPALARRDVFVCENPTVVALAARGLGRSCASLVCVNGQFATPSLVLLRQLRAAGACIRYHGDFDPSGLAIARRALAESGGRPWRFGAADYRAARKGERFAGTLGATPWDEALGAAMLADGHGLHEEAVFASLAEDLARVALP